MIWDLVTWLIWLYLVIISHAAGHFYKATSLGYSARLKWFSCVVYGKITPKHYYLISLVGVLAGFFALLLMSLWGFTTYEVLVANLIYLVGVKDDLKTMFKYKGEEVAI